MQRMHNGPVPEANAKLVNAIYEILNFSKSYVSILRIVPILDRNRPD